MATEMDVTVPIGATAGSVVEFQDALGTPRQAVVPDGFAPGDTFRVRVDLADIQMAQLNAGFERAAAVSAIAGRGASTGGSSPTWLHDILDALTADGFTKVVDAFLVSECAKFLTPGAHGHTLEQTLVHQRYVRIYESRIEAHLKRHGITSDDFFTALVDAEQRNPGTTSLASSLLLVNDFPSFATMMLQKALESGV